jgi:hypothetical protein
MVDEMHAIRGHGSQINWIEVTRSGQSGFGLSGLVSAGFNMTRQFVGTIESTYSRKCKIEKVLAP